MDYSITHRELKMGGCTYYCDKCGVITRLGTQGRVGIPLGSMTSNGRMEMSDMRKGKSSNISIARVMCAAWYPDIYTLDSKLDAHHIDDDPLNNHIDNLMVVTRQVNLLLRPRKAKLYHGSYAAGGKVDGIDHYLGTYHTEEEAQRAIWNFKYEQVERLMKEANLPLKKGWNKHANNEHK